MSKENEEKVIYKSADGRIEICEMQEGDLAGRTKIKMSALEICADETMYNKNGISWIEQYVNDNLESIKSAPYVVSWLNKDLGIPSDHGTMSFDDEGNVQFEGDTVGSIQDAYLTDIETDDGNKKVLMTEGVLYNQRYPEFVKWLKQEIVNNTIYGSIEINGKGKDKNIQYLNGNKNEDGTLKMGRVPTVYDFSGLAILFLTEPADDLSQVIELNSNNREGENENMANKKTKKDSKIKDTQVVEINDINYDDIACLITRAFNMAMCDGDMYCDYSYYIHKFYPLTGRVVMSSWGNVGEYYMTTYSITNSEVTIGEITEVEEDWKPVEEDTEVEVNAKLIKNIINKKIANKEEQKNMDEKIVTELNQKLEDKAVEVNNLQKNLEESKESLVEANKLIEANKAEKASADEELSACKEELNKVKEELNACKEELNKQKSEKDVAETNAYFETEIVKNGFEEAEINSLKEFVGKGDLAGLKSAEAELCAKKFKEMVASKENNIEVEVNAISTMIKTKEQTEKDIKGKKLPVFFN